MELHKAPPSHLTPSARRFPRHSTNIVTRFSMKMYQIISASDDSNFHLIHVRRLSMGRRYSVKVLFDLAPRLMIIMAGWR